MRSGPTQKDVRYSASAFADRASGFPDGAGAPRTNSASVFGLRSGPTRKDVRLSASAFADGASGFPDGAGAPRSDSASVFGSPYGNFKLPSSGTALETEEGSVSEDIRDGNAFSLSPPVLRRQDQGAQEAYGPEPADTDQPESGPTTDVALLLKGLQVTASIDPTLVKRSVSISKPTFGALAREESLQFAPHPVVTNCMNHHWNTLRNQKSLGADPWTPDAWPLASWPKPAASLPPARPIVSRALVEDPDVPAPGWPNESELSSLRKQGSAAKGFTPSAADRNMLLMETHIQKAMDGLQASASLTSALNSALRDGEDPDKLSSCPDSAAILDLLDALPAALTFLAKGLTAVRITSTVARRDAFLLQQEAERDVADKLRVLPLASGSMFGPYFKQCFELGPAVAPVSADEFARAMVRVMPAAPKPKPAQQGWGGGRARQQPRFKGRQQQQQKPKGRKPAGRGRQGGYSGKRNPPPPPRQGN